MKKASNILYLIGGIVGIVAAVVLFIAAIVYFILSSPAFGNFVLESLQNGSIKTDIEASPEVIVSILQMTFLTVAIVFTIVAVFAIIASVFSFKARKTPTKKLHILNIVFAALGGTYLSLVAAIFGLITGSNETASDEGNQAPQVFNEYKEESQKPSNDDMF